MDHPKSCMCMECVPDIAQYLMDEVDVDIDCGGVG